MTNKWDKVSAFDWEKHNHYNYALNLLLYNQESVNKTSWGVNGSLHFPLPSMNRLYQTEPATFAILLFWAFFRGSFFLYFSWQHIIPIDDPCYDQCYTKVCKISLALNQSSIFAYENIYDVNHCWCYSIQTKTVVSDTSLFWKCMYIIFLSALSCNNAQYGI